MGKHAPLTLKESPFFIFFKQTNKKQNKIHTNTGTHAHKHTPTNNRNSNNNNKTDFIVEFNTVFAEIIAQRILFYCMPTKKFFDFYLVIKRRKLYKICFFYKFESKYTCNGISALLLFSN